MSPLPRLPRAVVGHLGREPGRLASGIRAAGSGLGCFYTPGPVVAFMVRRALGAYLQAELPGEEVGSLDRLLDCGDPSGLRSPRAARDALARVTVCDPACGDGAFLVGALGQLEAPRVAISGLEESPVARRRLRTEIVADNLFGMELDAAAAESARSRLLALLLSLIHI